MTENQLLLKGSVLKNTEWARGFVVYAGAQTKLMLNAKKAGFKQSRLEGIVNQLVFCVFLLQLSICLVLSLLTLNWYKTKGEDKDYIDLDESLTMLWVKSFFRYFLLLNTLIPISLVVTIEVVKVLQARFMEWDAKMYNKDRDK